MRTKPLVGKPVAFVEQFLHHDLSDRG